MDRSLWLLHWLRLLGWFRRWVRDVRTFKGLVLTSLGALAFLILLASFRFAPRVFVSAQVDLIREYGPLAILAYCVLNLLLTPGDRSIRYSSAEVNFLFSGPYRPRQLLLSKVIGGALAAILTALIMTLAFSHHAVTPVSAFAGLFLTLELVYLFSLAVGLTASTFGALAYSRGRKLLLAAIGIVAVGSVWPVGLAALVLPFWEVVSRASRSPLASALLVPFRPFVMTFTAERLWPDLAVNASLAAIIDLALLAIVLTINAGFLEASAAASAQTHERLQRARKTGPPWARIALPMPPWWGGVGPNVWRQLTAASRVPTRLVMLAFLFLVPVVLTAARGANVDAEGFGPGLPAFVLIAISAQSAEGRDFRADRSRMEDLKALPISPMSMALGQILASVLILSGVGWISLAAMGRLDPTAAPLIAASAVILLPVNLVLVAVENLYFLCFPHEPEGATSLDLQTIGRQLLVGTAKAASLGVVGTLAGGAGALVYWFGGESLAAAVGASAVVAGAGGLGFVPVLALAFERFDVAGDAPE